MKILCKDQASLEAFNKLREEFPDSFRELNAEASVITPEELLAFLDKTNNDSAMMIDERIVEQLRLHEQAHQAVREARPDLFKKPQAGDELVLRIHPLEGTSLEDRLVAVLKAAKEGPIEVFAEVQEYLLSKADLDRRVVVTADTVLAIENIVNGVRGNVKIAMFGGQRRGQMDIIAALNASALMNENSLHDGLFANRRDKMADFGRDSGKKSRRPMVVSAKGNAYPLPKGARGVPRLGRTRGR